MSFQQVLCTIRQPQGAQRPGGNRKPRPKPGVDRVEVISRAQHWVADQVEGLTLHFPGVHHPDQPVGHVIDQNEGQKIAPVAPQPYCSRTMPAADAPVLQRATFAQHDAGAGDHQRQPSVAVHVEQARLAFGLGPGIDVALRDVAKVGCLGDHLRGVRHVVRRDGAGVDQSAHPRFQRRLSHAHGGADVVLQRRRPGFVRGFGKVEDGVNACHRRPQPFGIRQRHRHGINVIGNVIERATATAAQHPHVMPARNQHPGQVAPDEAGSADHHHLWVRLA